MDHGRPLRSIEDHELEQVARAIRAEHEISERFFRNVLDHDRVLQTMLDLALVDPMAATRREDLHERIVLRNRCRPTEDAQRLCRSSSSGAICRTSEAS